MHQYHSKWRKPTVRKSLRKNRQEAIAKRWQKEPTGAPNPPEPESTSLGPAEVSVPSTSSRKMSLFSEETPKKSKSESDNSQSDFVLVHKDCWQELFKQLKCTVCHKNALHVKFQEKSGFCNKLVVQCLDCEEKISQVFSSPRIFDDNTSRAPFKINRLMVESFINTGLGYSGLEKFCMEMGMETMSQRTWENHLRVIHSKSEVFKKEVLEKAVGCAREAHVEANPALQDQTLIDVAVSFDGSWHRRGHVSNYGISAVVDIQTGLILDFVVLSKYCHMCSVTAAEYGETSDEFKEWQERHKSSNECEENFSGSSNAMEMIGAEIIWKRSVEQNKMRYTTLLSDGDAKTFDHLQKLKIYGPKTKLDKEECINHVAKRAGTGMRNLVTTCKAQKITLGGKGEGQLTEDKINKLTGYYRKAILENVPDIKKMKSAVLATLDHCSSTDTKPRHQKCPKGRDSWCFYNSAKAKKEKPKPHSQMSLKLNETVVQKLKPLYERLSSNELLSRCARAGTQNSNESFHAVVWNKVPKTRFVSKSRIDIAVARAVAEFNMGCQTTLDLHLSSTNEELPDASKQLALRRDQRRKRKSAQQSEVTAKRARKKSASKKKQKEAAKKKKEGQTYGAGQF